MYKLVCTSLEDKYQVYEKEFGHRADLETYLADELVNDMRSGVVFKYEAFQKHDWQPLSVQVNFSVTI